MSMVEVLPSKTVRDLVRGDVLILDNEERATVILSRRSGIFETPTGTAFVVCWETEDGEERSQLAPPDAVVRVVEDTEKKMERTI